MSELKLKKDITEKLKRTINEQTKKLGNTGNRTRRVTHNNKAQRLTQERSRDRSLNSDNRANEGAGVAHDAKQPISKDTGQQATGEVTFNK